jgi:acetolactate synthase-1/3 small subunit
MKETHVLTIMVKNNAGVLARVASLFGRRGYNIESLSVSATNEISTSRMTVVVKGDESILQQIILQTEKLEEVINVYELAQEKSLYRELLLIKVFVDEKTRSSIREISEIYGAKIIDLSINTMVVELTGTPQKIDAFMEVLGQYRIVEMCRTGATALERGLSSSCSTSL